jgi:hypothetical protein
MEEKTGSATKQGQSVSGEEHVHKLAALSELEYSQVRKDYAKELGCKVSILDKLVFAERKVSDTSSIVEVLTPYPEEVDAVDLYDEIARTIESYIVLPQGTLHPLCLWCMGTYAFDEFHIFPKLIFHSPEKRCGKSTALDVVEAISSRALFSSSISPAAVFRVIEKYHPTLVIDEADTFISGRNDELIGIINSGHARNRAYVIRTVGDDHEPKQFSTWAPQVFASIKRLQDTVMDRAIVIELRRKTRDERTARIPATLKEDLKPLREKLLRWHTDNQLSLKLNPIEPGYIDSDRAVDNWLPLFTIANSISDECLAHCKQAYIHQNTHKDEQSVQLQLLEDIREIFSGYDSDRITSETLVEKLIDLEERPWCEWKRGQPMTKNSLAKLLDNFNIKSEQFRFGTLVRRGYERQFFDDAFQRYLSSTPETGDLKRYNATTASAMAISPNQSATHNDDVAFENPRKPLPHNDCSNVALQKDGKSEEVIEGITVRENESGLMHYQISDEVEDERS